MAATERREYRGTAPEAELDGGIDNSTESITLISGDGYPDGSVGPFFIVIDRGLSTEEKIKCLTRVDQAIAVVPGTGRGSDGTNASSHTTGAKVNHCYTADDADVANLHTSDTAVDNHTQYLNTTRHDAEHAGEGDWAAWTPTISADTGTPPTFGTTPVLEGRYQIGRTVNFWVVIQMGLSPVAGSDQWLISLPVAALTPTTASMVIGHGWLYDDNAGVARDVQCLLNTATTMRMVLTVSPYTAVSGGAPWTWALDDVISIRGSYEAD